MVHIEIRNVPDDVRRVLQERAAKEGLSLSAYMREYLAELARRPTPEELAERVQSPTGLQSDDPSSETVRKARRMGD